MIKGAEHKPSVFKKGSSHTHGHICLFSGRISQIFLMDLVLLSNPEH
jgi:hypothetical protein